jgi:hypothetical protein
VADYRGWAARAAELVPKRPVAKLVSMPGIPVNECSADGLLQATYLMGQCTGHKSPGDYGSVPEGDAARPFTATDNATQSLRGSNEADRLYKMVEQGFDTLEEAESTMDTIAYVTAPIELGCELHNRMITNANTFSTFWKAGGQESQKDTWALSSRTLYPALLWPVAPPCP